MADDFAGDVKEAIENFQKRDPGIKKFFASSRGYVVFPNVGKGGFIFGGAHGNGFVYEGGKLIGKASLVQGTFGLQAGAQEFSEVIFFESEKTLKEFKKGKFSLSAQVSAVVAAEGRAEKARYQLGVAVFLLPKGGLMVEAAVGGQKFNFEPIGKGGK